MESVLCQLLFFSFGKDGYRYLRLAGVMLWVGVDGAISGRQDTEY